MIPGLRSPGATRKWWETPGKTCAPLQVVSDHFQAFPRVSHSIVSRDHTPLFSYGFRNAARETTDISSVAHIRLPANVGGGRQGIVTSAAPKGSISGDLAEWLDKKNMRHIRFAPYHPKTQGKIERWHQTLKNRILLDNSYLPGDLEQRIAAFVTHYNHDRYHGSLDNLTPADVYFGHGQTILEERNRIKRQTIANRRLQHQLQAA